jgi:hypothetical protein
VEWTVVSDHLAGEERDADDDNEEGVQRRTRDEQTRPVYRVQRVHPCRLGRTTGRSWVQFFLLILTLLRDSRARWDFLLSCVQVIKKLRD